MSIEMWTNPTTKIQYPIGTVGIELPSFKQLLWSDFEKTEYWMIPVPTYGYWGGPGWSGGKRILDDSRVNWSYSPCYNNNIKAAGADPNQCLSLMDAITKTHDWRYHQAEEAQKAGYTAAAKQMIIDADLHLMQDLAGALSTGTYNSPTGVYNETTKTFDNVMTLYTNTFDGTEIEYAAGVSVLFTLKLFFADDASMAEKSEGMQACANIWGGIGITDVTYTDPSDTSKTMHVHKESNGIICEFSDGISKIGSAIDTNTQKVYQMGTVIFGAGSVSSEETFVYEGGGRIRINGGSGNDKIWVGENENTATTFVLSGGGGYDTYYLKHGINYELTDSGANKIYIEDENGKYNSIGNLYKNTTGDVWYSTDGYEELSKVDNIWTLTFDDGTTIGLGATFQSGDFGINLLPHATNPVTDPTIITGDLTPVDCDPSLPGIQQGCDQWGNVITDPAQPDPGRADILFDTSGNDLILSGAGDDYIVADYGGDNWIKGGTGYDLMDGEASNSCTIEGGTGSDIIFGSYGASSVTKLFGDSYGEMSALIAAGETGVRGVLRSL